MDDQARIERFERERRERIEKALERFETSLHKPQHYKKWVKWKNRHDQLDRMTVLHDHDHDEGVKE